MSTQSKVVVANDAFWTAAKKPDWIAFTNPLEVLPRNDLREHVFGRKCWCKPFEEDDVIVHNSMDGRERFERLEWKAS